MITLNTRKEHWLRDIQPDELLSSWANRNGVDIAPNTSREERDYGVLYLDLPSASVGLLHGLQESADPPDEQILPPYARTLYCPQCMAGDWAIGNTPYRRRSWTVTWRTCCLQHGQLFDTHGVDRPLTFAETLQLESWIGRWIAIWRPGSREPKHSLTIGADRRAIHLECALAARHEINYGGWFPAGFNGDSLFEAYIDLLRALLNQFGLFESRTRSAESVWQRFATLPNLIRYGLNVLAEAIIARWSGTPLPERDAPSFRTRLLLHAIGWGLDPLPVVKANYVLIDSHFLLSDPSLIDACAMHFRDLDQKSLRRNRATQGKGFTRRQAEAIGLPVVAYDLLGQLTRLGRLGQLDRRGRLILRSRAAPLSWAEGQYLWQLQLPTPLKTSGLFLPTA